LIEQVGGVEGVYRTDALPDNFLARRTAGNAVEILGIVASRVTGLDSAAGGRLWHGPAPSYRK
jgi:hypothetical protein